MSDLVDLARMVVAYPRPRRSWRERTRELLVAAASLTAAGRTGSGASGDDADRQRKTSPAMRPPAERPSAAGDTRSLTTTSSASQTPTRETHCSCGRPAREVLDGGEFGPTAYCGAPFPPLDPCDCDQPYQGHRHSRNVCHIYGRGASTNTTPIT